MEALYNKYRPKIFEDVVGQEHIERTIKNALASNKISHAYMFTGPRGTGKTTTARLLSKALLCESGPTPDPDGTCEDCELIAAGEHPDVYELDAASRTGVENVREEIIGKVDYAPTRGKYKVYIIDEVHMLSTAAFNALLKTLEEPPDHVIFIMCTTDPQKVPETILSRCQRFDFRRISSEEMVSRLGAICEMEDITFEGDALDLIAHRAQGGMRDALTSLEQLIAFGNGDVTMDVAERLLGSLDSSDLAEIVKAIGTRNIAECFNWTSSYMETGADLVQFVGDLTKHIRDMYVMSLAGADVALEVTEAGRRELEVELSWYGSDRLARMLEVLGDLTKELKTSTNQRLSFEIALTRMVRPESDLTLSSLSERIETLERALKNGSIAQLEAAPVASSTKDNAVATNTTQTIEPSDKATHGAHVQNEEPDVSESSIPEAASESTEQEPVASVSMHTGDINATQAWNSTLAHLKKIGPAYGVIFINSEARMDNDVLIIEFSKNNDFAFKASQKQDAREALEQAFERAGYPGIKYQIVQSSSQEANDKDSDVLPPTTSTIENASVSALQDDKPADEKPIFEKQPEEPTNYEPAKQDVSNEKPEHVYESSAEEATEAAAQTAPVDSATQSYEDVPPWEEIPEPQDEVAESDSDLQDILTSAFGEGVVVEEVKE